MKLKLVFVFFSIILILAVIFQPPPAGHSAEWPNEYYRLEGGKSVALGIGVKTMMIYSGLKGLTMETENGYGPYLQTYVPSGSCKVIETLPLVFIDDAGESEPAHKIEICNPWLGHPRYRILN